MSDGHQSATAVAITSPGISEARIDPWEGPGYLAIGRAQTLDPMSHWELDALAITVYLPIW